MNLVKDSFLCSELADSKKDQSSQPKDWAQGAQVGYEEDRSSNQGASKYEPRTVSSRLEARLAKFHESEVHIGSARGVKRIYQQSKRAALLSLQALVALFIIMFDVFHFWWQASLSSYSGLDCALCSVTRLLSHTRKRRSPVISKFFLNAKPLRKILSASQIHDRYGI